MGITTTVENDSISLPLHVPDGTQLDITPTPPNPLPPAAAGGSSAARSPKYVGIADARPKDFAAPP